MCDPVSAVLGGVGLIEGNKNRKAAKRAQNSADALAYEQLDLAEREFEFNKANLQEQQQFERDYAIEGRTYSRQKSEEDYQRKLGLTKELREASEISDAERERLLGNITGDVNVAFDTTSAAARRHLTRRGATPGAGAYQALNRNLALTKAATIAGERNKTRLGLSLADREGRINAINAGLSVNRLIPGSGSTPGGYAPVSNRAINVLGDLSASRSQSAQQYGSAASDAIGAALGSIAYRAGRNYTPSPEPVTHWT